MLRYTETMTTRKSRSEASPEAVVKATGKSPEEWNSILDAAGARDLTHKEIATMLREEHGVLSVVEPARDRRL